MEELMALQKFKEGYNCSQSIFYHYAERAGLSTDLALRLATGFGGGMGRKQEVCGALSGGILVISALYGMGNNQSKEQQYTVYKKVREFLEEFQNRTGEILCRNLLDGCNLLEANGQQRFNDENMKEKCYSYLKIVVEILDSKIIV